MPPLIQLPRTKLSKNFAQFLLRSSGKSGRVFFFLFFPFFLLRRGGNTGELCQSCQRRDANAVLRPTTANCGIADLWRWRKIGNSSIERSTNGCLSLTRVQCSFARSNLWNSRAIPRQFLSIVVASGSFSLSVTLLASSLLFRRFRSVAFFLPSMRFFFGISTIPEVSVELCSSWITEDDRSSRNTHLPRLWHTRDLTIRQFLLYNSCSIGKQIFRFPSLRTNVRQFQAESSSLLLFIPNLFKLSNTSLRRSLDDVHDKKKKKIPSPAIPNRDPSKKKKKKKFSTLLDTRSSL